MEKQILMEFMQTYCVGYANKMSGRDIEAHTGIDYKRVSEIVLRNLDMNIMNVNGYFIPVREDIKVLTHKAVKLEQDHKIIANRQKQIKRIMFELDENKLGEL